MSIVLYNFITKENHMKDLRDLTETFTDIDTAKQSENNIIYQNNNISDILHIIDLNKIRSKGESSSSSTRIGRASLEASPPESSTPIVSVIGVSLDQPTKKHPDRRSLRLSILKDDGSNNKYSCKLAHYDRKRELLSNIPNDIKDYWGYADALEFISNLPDKQNAHIGKLKNTTTYKWGTPVNMPIVAKTAVVLWLDEEGVHTMIWLGDNQYKVDLYDKSLTDKQKQFYIATGYWRNEEFDIVEEF